MTTKIYILLFAFGFFMIPNAIFSCNKGAKDHTCKIEVAANGTKKMTCCDGKKSSDKKECDGKCGHANCGCSSASSSVSFNLTINNFSKNNNFDFSHNRRKQFSYVIPSISDGFQSIWLIPKIG